MMSEAELFDLLATLLTRLFPLLALLGELRLQRFVALGDVGIDLRNLLVGVGVAEDALDPGPDLLEEA